MGTDHVVDFLVYFALYVLVIGHLQEEIIQCCCRGADAGDEEVEQRYK